jgi:two-component system response regulator DesR
MIRVVVAEDQSMVLGALAAPRDRERHRGHRSRARRARSLGLVERLSPDILLTDIEMPERSGLEVAAEVTRRALATRVIILTTFARAGYLRRALDAGPRDTC